MTGKRPEKLSERMEVRLPYSDKRRFLTACRRMGDVPSDVLRAAMTDYVARVEAAARPKLTEELTMKLVRNPLKAFGSAAALSLGAVLFAAQPSAADRDTQPLALPTVSYPIDMAEQGISAECEAMFAVSAGGQPEDVRVTCSHPGFVASMHQAIETIRFEPKIENGVAVRRSGVVYPIIFRIDPETETIEGPDQ